MFKSFLPDIWDDKIEKEEEEKDEEENRSSLSFPLPPSPFDDRHQEQQDFEFNDDDEFLVIHKLDSYSNEITFTTFDFHDLEKVVNREI